MSILCSEFSSDFPLHSENKLKSSWWPTRPTGCSPACLLHPFVLLPPPPVFTHHSTLAFLLLLSNTRHTPTICRICFSCFLYTVPYPLEFNFYGGKDFCVFGHRCIPNILNSAWHCWVTIKESWLKFLWQLPTAYSGDCVKAPVLQIRPSAFGFLLTLLASSAITHTPKYTAFFHNACVTQTVSLPKMIFHLFQLNSHSIQFLASHYFLGTLAWFPPESDTHSFILQNNHLLPPIYHWSDYGENICMSVFPGRLWTACGEEWSSAFVSPAST